MVGSGRLRCTGAWGCPVSPAGRIALAAALTLAVSGCKAGQRSPVGGGSTTPATQTSGVADPCRVFSSSDLKEILGEEISGTEPIPSDDREIAGCTIDTASFPGRLRIALSHHASVEDAQAAAKSDGGDLVPGLGDEAYLLAGGGEFDVSVRKGTSVIRLVLASDDPAGADQVKTLAARALSKI